MNKTTDYTKCKACGYQCIEDNIVIEKRIHMDIKHNGDYVEWV